MARKSPDNMRVAVLAGGSSSEREISFESGRNAAAALREAGYGSVEVLDPADESFIATISALKPDVAFIALHGAGGEDGQIQSILEYLKIPYTGSDVMASAYGSDKNVAKLLYAQAGIPVARGLPIKRGVPIDVDRVVSIVGEKMFVKPAVNGSSYGISLVKDPADLLKAIEKAFEYDDEVLVEECLEGTEITVGVYGADDAHALPIVEIRKPEDSEFYDLAVKYIDPTDIHRIPAQIPAADYERAQELAVQAHQALGCFGISRSDFIVTDRGPIILETNTIPGMTDTSLYPDEVRHTEMTFDEICDGLVQMALDRAEAAC